MQLYLPPRREFTDKRANTRSTSCNALRSRIVAFTLFLSTAALVSCGGSSESGSTVLMDASDPSDSVSLDSRSTTQVIFEIEVPAYQSDELRVDLVWDEKELVAEWVGDEFWRATDSFPTDTEHLLTATFYDGNGTITLGSYEDFYRTGVNDAEIYSIAATDFDTDRWDSDADGQSNLAELRAGSDPLDSPKVLLFSETRGFRHDSIPDALQALEEIATSAGLQTVRAADSTDFFTVENLSEYDAVVWVLTSGDVLNVSEQLAFEAYVQSGGAYVGIHAASDTEYEWPWYGELVGAYFQRHPEIQSATMFVEDSSHASTSHLGSTWTRTDEWYDFRENPRARVNVLLSLDETSYNGGTMGTDHPIAWFHEYSGGRAWYTGGGHTSASYAEPDFRAHLLGGLRYAVGVEE